MRKLAGFLAGAVFAVVSAGLTTAEAKVIIKNVEYKAGGTVLKGYLAYDDAIKNKRAGVLVLPEWWGLNDYVRKRARMLAELGYAALAVDMYGNGKQAKTADEAGKMSSAVMKDFDVAKERLGAAEDFLKRQPTVDADRIAGIGYCFGGGVLLNIARQGTDLKDIVSFHGSLGALKPAQPGTIRAKLLVLQGSDDKFVTPDKVEAFKKEMTADGADYKFISYPGATHAFSNPEATALGKKFNLPIAYNKKADEASWSEMTKFLADTLK